MVMTLPGGYNTHIASLEDSDKLIIGYSRNPDKFALNRYIQIKPVKSKVGLYLQINAEEAGRILSSDLSEFVWADGNDRPQNNDGTEMFNLASFRTKRYNYGFRLGRDSEENADWDVLNSHKAIKAQQAMTARTVKVHGVLGSDGNWESGHVLDVTSDVTGNTGAWNESTVERQDIKRSLNFAALKIRKTTLGAVTEDDMVLLLDPVAAFALGGTQEIVNYIKSSPDAYGAITQGGKWSRYGLPNKLYGYNIVVEDAVKVTNRRGATKATSFVAAEGVAYLLSRVGALSAPEGTSGPSFSTLTMLVKEEMKVEEFSDDKNRRIEGHIVDDFDVVMTSPVSGVKFTGILA